MNKPLTSVVRAKTSDAVEDKTENKEKRKKRKRVTRKRPSLYPRRQLIDAIVFETGSFVPGDLQFLLRKDGSQDGLAEQKYSYRK